MGWPRRSRNWTSFSLPWERAWDGHKAMTTRREVLTLGAAAIAMPGVGMLLAAVPRASRPLDILVLGATGFFGPHQVEHALARRHHPTLFNRGLNDPATIHTDRVEVL